MPPYPGCVRGFRKSREKEKAAGYLWSIIAYDLPRQSREILGILRENMIGNLCNWVYAENTIG